MTDVVGLALYQSLFILILDLQSTWRAYVVRKAVHALQRRLAARRIKEAWLTYLQRKKLKSIRLIQSQWRGYMARKR